MPDDKGSVESAYLKWREADKAEAEIEERTQDESHPKYIAAVERRKSAMEEFIYAASLSLEDILLKLKIACLTSDEIEDAISGQNNYLSPRLILSATHDLEYIMMVEGEGKT